MSSASGPRSRSEEHTSELQSPYDLVCRLLLEKKKQDPGSARIVVQLTARPGGDHDSTSRDHPPIHFTQIFFFNDTPPPEIYTLSLHDALPIWPSKAAIEAVLTQTPRSPPSSGSLSFIAPAAKRRTLKVPIRLTRKTVSNGRS